MCCSVVSVGVRLRLHLSSYNLFLFNTAFHHTTITFREQFMKHFAVTLLLIAASSSWSIRCSSGSCPLFIPGVELSGMWLACEVVSDDISMFQHNLGVCSCVEMLRWGHMSSFLTLITSPCSGLLPPPPAAAAANISKENKNKITAFSPGSNLQNFTFKWPILREDIEANLVKVSSENQSWKYWGWTNYKI